jgi:hypothetical protein
MGNILKKIIILSIIAIFISCLGIKLVDKSYYLGNFSESKYDFFESFRHNPQNDFYYELPFDLKFGGIRSFSFDSIEKKDYSWLRKSNNLEVAFNAFSSVGLDKFISKDKYFKKNKNWCCKTEWENKSLNEIISGFIKSDTTSNAQDYYSKFWKRRKLENNLKVTYEILIQIDKFYNESKNEMIFKNTDSVLTNLLDYDMKLIHSDSTKLKTNIFNYFEYLKSVGLNYSAYKIIYNNPRLKISMRMKDSLIGTIKHDTLSFESWEKLNDNLNGWITSDFYPDNKRYYGP